MSAHLIHKYYAEVEKTVRFGGSSKETAVRSAFLNLLNEYARQKDLMLIPELDFKVPGTGKTVRPDGTLKDALRLDWGYWESKDLGDDLEKEVEKKFRLGYPNSNILFENGHTAILYQRGQISGTCAMSEAEKLDHLITEFISYTRPEIRHFREALELFKKDIPTILDSLRDMILAQSKENTRFRTAQEGFLALCRETINPAVTPEDVNEMLIQHILTEEIFTSVFEDPQFHQENNISKELHKLEDTFFTGGIRRNTLDSIKPYYAAIKAQAGAIANYSEKQMFLKSIYENFYKVYNPKAADRLGVVYTPNEIVNFMIEGTDYLLHKHFGKLLASKNVEILDPATGTGTFIIDIINYLPPHELPYKYKNEMHCNEVAILPYYIANLGIESTYKQRTGQYEEFKNICFVDTLDNMGFEFAGQQKSLFGLSAENAERVKKQNRRKISVIIGNPPYNANQQNENDNNKNRSYSRKDNSGIDNRIKETFIKYSTAQKTKVYDMYARFYRWAMDRIDDDGVICYISNNSFINARTFDGFRKCVQDEFDYAYIIDLGGNIRELSGKDGIFLNEEHTIFGVAAAVGIAIMFLVKKKATQKLPCKIYYIHPTDIRATRIEKFDFLQANKMSEINFQLIEPDKNNNWINLAINDFDELNPLIDKAVKLGRKKEGSIFNLYSLGVVTNRDEWVLGESREQLFTKLQFFIEHYNKYTLENFIEGDGKEVEFDNVIKWTRDLKRYARKGHFLDFDWQCIVRTLFRPFTISYYYYDSEANEMLYQMPKIFEPTNPQNIVIAVNVNGFYFSCLATNLVPNLHLTGDSQCLPLYRYDKNGNRVDNITDWGLKQFTEHYQDTKITKEDIFHYTYAVLHNPAYRKKYELNLKREFPRIPFYEDFHQWAAWGKQLMDLHINFETATPYPLKRFDNFQKVVKSDTEKSGGNSNQLANEPVDGHNSDAPLSRIGTPKAKLKADKEAGTIILDEDTVLTGVPKSAWDYKLGNRSALEWILDQYKEKKPKDPTIAALFNTYRFADYKEKVIDLLMRVCTVSVETMRVVGEMEEGKHI